MLNNRIVGLTLGHINVTELAEPLEITFSHQYQPPVSPPPWPGSSRGAHGQVGIPRHIDRHAGDSAPSYPPTSTWEKPLGPDTQLCPWIHVQPMHACPPNMLHSRAPRGARWTWETHMHTHGFTHLLCVPLKEPPDIHPSHPHQSTPHTLTWDTSNASNVVPM